MSTPVLLLRLHAVVVLVTFVFFGCKLLLLLTGRREMLGHLRARTRWADSVLVGVVLLSGVSVWATSPSLDAFSLALQLGVLALLLVCVWALRRERSSLALGSLLATFALTGFLVYPMVYPMRTAHQPQATILSAPPGKAEATATPDAAAPVDTAAISPADLATINSAQLAAQDSATAQPATPVLAAGKVLYTQNCAVCHGADGRLGLNGARDLTKSNLNDAGRVYQVTHGSISKKMPAFQGKLTDEQIRQVVEYSLTLR
ncbi:c-type cytochrome [Hymenobacter endophyticus]|uniref:Cytochrome c n=1 Tax=Hymenobacter endophyticus TaxID=3076335 RepID=A0ABU3TE39_9BACT|nr:cytochrome c [Hymenobacter endophyticus]MDU0369646.1 cytochrome c [Hymenobacter endophyticus]